MCPVPQVDRRCAWTHLLASPVWCARVPDPLGGGTRAHAVTTARVYEDLDTACPIVDGLQRMYEPVPTQLRKDIMTTQSFSGSHPFRPACLVAAHMASMEGEYNDPEEGREEAIEFAAARVPAIDAGRCARCDVSLADGEFPAGSRVTDCRCIPICSCCGRAEAFTGIAMASIGGPKGRSLLPLIAPVCYWPVDHGEQEAGVAAIMGRAVEREGFVASGSDGSSLLVSEEGVAQLQFREHSGGWAEVGYDDSLDDAERER